jgi:hypothetical protein
MKGDDRNRMQAEHEDTTLSALSKRDRWRRGVFQYRGRRRLLVMRDVRVRHRQRRRTNAPPRTRSRARCRHDDRIRGSGVAWAGHRNGDNAVARDAGAGITPPPKSRARVCEVDGSHVCCRGRPWARRGWPCTQLSGSPRAPCAPGRPTPESIGGRPPIPGVTGRRRFATPGLPRHRGSVLRCEHVLQLASPI